ncbi:hypothetical protein [Azospirillum soli]|uniref:hypothetical protein n=1 Tax=Azospirillum soli TaxID=1304799 RepID=UPI001AEB6E1E|nr:hypothetical protein [Azospirillum soli]MBP2313981.1 hypothetical protein [Azospirillum soli]
MYNLIVVIIAVALTAVMGAAGVFYGGSAFTSAGPKAAAIGVIQNMAQMQGAWMLYTSNGNTTSTTVPTMTATGLSTDLISGGYLAAVPTAPTIATTFGATGTAAYQLDLTSSPGPGIFIVLNSTSGSQCLEIAKAGGMVSPTGNLAAPGVTGVPNLSTSVISNATLNTALTGFKFGCVGLGTNPTGLSLGSGAGIAFLAGDGLAGGVQKYLVYYKQ